MRWTERAVHVRNKKNGCILLVGRPEGKRRLEGPRLLWENNITIDLRGIRLGDMGCIDLAHDTDQWRALVNVVVNFRAHKMFGNS
jgi:hypothetical protein